jgi:hypothetical protein
MTAFEMLVRLARELNDSFEGSATGGSATTLVDTRLAYPDDTWNNGTLLMVSGARASTTIVPTDWVEATATLTIPTGTAIAAGAKYILVKPRWPRSELLRALNVGLSKQAIIKSNETLTVTADTKEYTLPSGVAGVVRVESGTAALGWTPHQHWQEQEGKLVFYNHEPTDTALSLRLRYYPAQHAELTADTDTIDVKIDLDLLQLEALASIYQRWVATVRNHEPFEKELAKMYEQQAMMRRQNRTRPQPAAKLS